MRTTKLLTMSSLLAGVLLSNEANSQGWVSGANNSLYSVNSSLATTPVSIGIGTNVPSANFHTVGTLRHEGLLQSNQSRVLVTDVSGNVYWRDVSSLGAQNAWTLTGNAGTDPATNFIGTTDAKRVVFATNATERMTILPTGQVGIGNINPTSGLLTVGNGTAGIGAQGNQLYTFQLLGKGANAVEHLGMFNNDQVTSRSELTVSNSGNGRWEDNFVAIMVHGSAFNYQNRNDYYLSQNNAGYALINAQTNAAANVPLRKFAIGVYSPNIPLSFYTNNIERVFINGNGQTGIATITPTAALHVNCTGVALTGASNIRFENLQQGAGNVLVIDANGNVFRSTASQAKATPSTEIAALKNEIEALRAQVKELSTIVSTIKSSLNGKTPRNEAVVYQNMPNPFTESTVIKYQIPTTAQKATIQISDMSGKVIKAYPLSASGNEQSFQVHAGDLTAGSYFYSLIVDSKVVESKKMVVAH